MGMEMKEDQKRSRRNRRGFTLVEVAMAVTFFSLLSLAIFSTVSSASTILQMQILHAGINQGGMQMIRSIGREIAESSPVADQSHLIVTEDPALNNDTPRKHNNIVTFQVPVDWDHDGNVVEGTLAQAVEWGAYPFLSKPPNPSWTGLNGWIKYRVANNQLLREILDSSTGTALATDIIIPRDVLAFYVTPFSTRRYNINLKIRKADTVNQKGATARTYETTFGGDILLRNGS